MAFVDGQSGGIVKSGRVPSFVKVIGAVSLGDALGYSGGWKRALATVATAIQMRCIAGEDGVDGQEVLAYFEQADVEGRFTGATAGGAVYVAEGTSNGMYTQTAPTTTGDCNKIVGYAITATKLHIEPPLNSDTIA